MSSYFLALIDIHDPKRYEQYLAGFDEVFSNYRGQVVAVEDAPRVLEGTWPAKRTVLIKFPNDKELRRWYNSKEYQQLAIHRQAAAFSRAAILTGRPADTEVDE
jgi:uncharacterized protein (DUF1330 family)